MSMRPLSPHLQIYKLQMTSFLSITNRFSEVIVFVGALLWAAFLLFDQTLPYWLYEWPGKWLVLLALMTFTYHLLGVARHTLLDLGWGFSLSAIYGVGWALLAAWLLLGGFFYRCLL